MSVHPLAVRKSSFATDANRSLGSAVVTLKTRTDIQTVADLKGKVISASLPDSLGGWLAFAGELAAEGHDPESFFLRVDFETYQIPEVVGSVLTGRSDAGVLSTCQLETAQERGLIEAGKLKVSKLLQGVAFRRRAAVGKCHGKSRLDGIGHGRVLRDKRQKNLGKANQNAG